MNDEKKGNMGWCHCCRRDTYFSVLGCWLRDQYICTSCSSIPRQRAVNKILDDYFPDWQKAELHESCPSNDFIARWSNAYSCSALLESVDLGMAGHNGVRSENLEQLTFENERFDLFVTQDVMEHVFDPEQAFREVMRVLKPNGAHVFTAPKHEDLKNSRARTRRSRGEVKYLLDPEYHGSPVGDGRVLVTWDYGDDFEWLIWKWCSYPTTTYVIRDRRLGLDGEYLEVFVTRKVT